MAEGIPNYIGSKLGSFSDEEIETDIDQSTYVEVSEREESITLVQSEDDNGNTHVIKPIIKKSKNIKAMAKSRKKTSGAKKSLPVNPGANTSPVAESLVEQAPIDLGETTEQITQPEQKGPSLADSLKSLVGKKKKPLKAKAPVKKKRAPEKAESKLPEINLPVKEEEQPVSEKPVTQPEHEAIPEIPVATIEDLLATQKELEKKELEKKKLENTAVVKKTPPAPVAEKKVVSNKAAEVKQQSEDAARATSEVNERKAYVQQLREETQSLLVRLAEERKQRELEFQEFRENLRKQLKGN